MPNLDGIHPVPARELTGFEQKINQCRGRPAACVKLRIAKGFAEMPALWMRTANRAGE